MIASPFSRVSAHRPANLRPSPLETRIDKRGITRFAQALFLAATAAFAGNAKADIITKADNTDALNLTSSWAGGILPTNLDIALWDSTVTSPNSVVLGADLNLGQLRITNPAGAVTIGGANLLTLAGVSGVGIDLSSASQNLTLTSGVALGAAQSWDVASGRILTTTGALNLGGFTLSTGGAGNVNVSGVVSNGSITQNGTGILSLTGANTYSGATTINSGTVRAAASTGSSALGTSAVALNGGTLQLDVTASTSTVGLTGRSFSGAVTSNLLSNANFTGTATDVRNYFTSGTATIGNSATPTAFYTGGPTTNFAMQWTGKINISTAGAYNFFTSSDDGSRLFIDGVLVANSDGSHGSSEAGSALSLSPGLHDIRIEYVQGSGGDIETFSYQGPGITKQAIPASVLFTAESAATTGASNDVVLGNNVSVSGNSTINLNGANFTSARIGSLTAANASTLNLTGLSGKTLRATSTALPSGGSTTFTNTPDLALGQVTDGGTATTLTKTGAGRLIFDNTAAAGGASSLVSGSLIDVQAGKAVLVGISGGTNPIGSAGLKLSGGGLVLDTKSGSVTFDNALVVSAEGTIEVVPGSLAGTPSVTLGSATRGITLDPTKTLTIDVYGGSRNTSSVAFSGPVVNNGATFVGAGVITGGGNLAIRSTQYNIGQAPVPGSVTLQAANNYTGTTTLTGPYTVGGATQLALTLNSGGRLTGTTDITLRNARLAIDSSATQLDRVNDAAQISLNSGTIAFTGSTTASAAETFDKLVINSGTNALTLANIGAGFATTLTGASLERNNNAFVTFQGASLGAAATNATQVKFTTAPTLTGAGGAAGTSTMSILPFAMATAQPSGTLTWNAATYDVNGIRPLNTSTEQTTLAASGATSNARTTLTNSTASASARTVNSYVLDTTATSGGPITLDLSSSAGVLKPTSGLMAFTATSATPQALVLTGSTLDFGTAEGQLVVMNTAGATVSSKISGSNGITISGPGALTLTNTGVNDFTGKVSINGFLNLNNDAALGDVSNPIQFGGGTLKFNTAGISLASTRAVTLLGTIGDTGGVFDTSANSGTVAGQVTGTGGLVKIGANTLTLSNSTNNYSGLTNVYQGTLVTNSGPTGNIALSSSTVVQFDQSFDGTYNGTISGLGSFVKSGSGILTIGSVNPLAAGFTVNGGTLKLGVDGTLGTNAGVVVGAGAGSVGTLDLNGKNQTFGTLTFGGTTANATSQGVVNIGSGVLQFPGALTYLANNNPLGAQINGGAIDLGGSARTFTVNDSTNASADLTVSSVVQNGAVTKAGAGVLALTSANTYTGVTTINAGAIRAVDGTGVSANSNLTLNGGVFESNGSFTRDLGTGANQVQLTGGASGFSANGGAYSINLGGAAATLSWGSPTFSPTTFVLNDISADSAITLLNPIDLNSGTARTIGVNANTATIGTLISNSGGAGGLTKSGAGTLVITNANTYTGPTTISGGALSVSSIGNGGVPSQLGASSNATANLVFNGGIIQYTGASASTDRNATLSGAGGIEVTNAATNFEFASNIVGATSEKAFVKSGPGTLTLSGAADNAFLALSVNQGTVILNKASSASFKAVSSVQSVAAGTTLQLAGTGGNQINGDLKLVNGTVEMNGRNEAVGVFTGGATGVLTNNAAGTISLLTYGTAGGNFAGSIQDGASGGRVGIIAGAGVANLLTLSGNNTFTGGTQLNTGWTIFSNANAVARFGRNVNLTGGVGVLDFTNIQPLLVSAVNGSSVGTIGLTANSAAENLDFSAASGANQTNLFLGTQNGASVNYTGTITPNANVYRIGGGGGTLTLGNTNALTDDGAISRRLIVGALGGGTTALTASNNYSGGTTLNSGAILVFSANNNLGSGGITVAASSTLRWAAGNTDDISGRNISITTGTLTADVGTNNVTFANGIGSGSAGALTKTGAGKLTLQGINTYTGTTTISAGTVELANPSALRNSTVTISAANGLVFPIGVGGVFVTGALAGASNQALVDSSAGAITLQAGFNNASTSYTGVLSGIGGFTKIGSGTQTFTTAQTYTGATSVINGPGTSQATSGILKLDFSAATPTTNLLSTSSPLVLGGDISTNAQTIAGGGTLNLTGKASTTNSQAFANTTVGIGASAIQLTANATANPLALTLGSVTRNTGGTVDLTQPTGTISATNGVQTVTGTASTLLTSAAGTAYATVGGTDWAAKDATNAFVVGLSTVSGYTASNSAATFSGNSDITGAFTGNAGATVNSIRFNTGALTLTLGAGPNTVSTGGILVGNGATSATIGGGSLTAGAGNELVFIANKGLTINAQLTGASTSVTYRGGANNIVIGTGTNNYGGSTYITSGRLNTGSQNNPFSTGSVYINGNTNGQFFKSGGGTSTNQFYIVGNGWAETNGPYGAIRADNSTVAGPITLLGDAAIGVVSATGTGTFSGNIDGAFALTKLGGGIAVLSGASNTYSGGTVITNGTLQFNSATALPSTGNVTVANGGAVGFNYAVAGGLQSALNTRIASNSAGIIGLFPSQASENIDLSATGANLANLQVGALPGQTVSYTGTLTPNGNVYRLANSGTLTINGTNAITGAGKSLVIGTNVSGAGAQTPGALTLGGSNNYTGGTTLNGATVVFANGSLGTGPIVANNGNTLRWATGNTQDLSVNGITFATSGQSTTLDTNGNNVTLANSIGGSGAGGFTKAGAGSLTLSSGALYSGATAITAGSLIVPGGNSIPDSSTVTVTGSTASTAWTINASETVNGIATTGTFTTGAAGLTLNNNAVLSFGRDNASPSYDGIISGSGGLTKLGTGSIFLRNANTYTGPTTVNQGVLAVDMSQTFSPASNGLSTATNVTLGGGTLQILGKNAVTNNSQTLTNAVTLATGGSTIEIKNQSASNNVSLTLSAGLTRQSGSTVNFVTNGNTGTITSTGTANTDYTAIGGNNTIIGGWATQSSVAGVAPTSTPGSTFAVSTAGVISGLPTGSYSTSYAAGTNVDSGSGAQSIGGSALTLNALRFNAAAATTVDATGNLTIASGGILVTPTVAANTVTLNNGTITSGESELFLIVNNTQANGLVINSKVTGNIGVTKSGGGDLNLTNTANDFTGTLTVNGGRVILPSAVSMSNAIVINPGAGLTGVGAITTTGTTTLSGPITANAATTAGDTFSNSGGSLTISGAITAPAGVIVGTRLGTLVLSGGGNYTNFRIAQDTVNLGANDGVATNAVMDIATSGTGTFDLKGFNQTLAGLVRSAGNTANVANTGATPSTLTLSPVANASLTFPGVISGNINLVKSGSGTQTLSGANTFTGNVTVNAGTLNVTNTQAANGALTINGGTANINAATAFTSTTVNNGTVVLGHVNALGVGSQLSQNPLTLNGGTVDLNGMNNLSVAALSGTGGTITDNGTTAGSTTLSAASNSNATFAGAIQDGATRKLAFTKAGNGILNLSGANAFTGPTEILGGTLNVTGSITGSSKVDVLATAALLANGTLTADTFNVAGTLGGSGTINGPVAISGNLAPGNSPGTLTFNDSLALNNNSAFNLEITSASTFDKVIADGIALTGTVQLSIQLGYAPEYGTSFLVMENTSANPIAGLFTVGGVTINEGDTFAIAGGQEFQLTYAAGSGTNDVLLTAVPEPSSALALLSGLGLLAGYKRNRRRRD